MSTTPTDLDYEQESVHVHEEEKDLDEDEDWFATLQPALRLHMFSAGHVSPLFRAPAGC